MTNKVEWLFVECFNFPNICLCLNEKQYEAALTGMKIDRREWGYFIKNEHSSATMHTLANDTGKLVHLVCLRPNLKIKPEQIYAMLVHEAVHIWQKFRKHIGERKPSSEFEAYFIQSISQVLIESYLKQTKRK